MEGTAKPSTDLLTFLGAKIKIQDDLVSELGRLVVEQKFEGEKVILEKGAPCTDLIFLCSGSVQHLQHLKFQDYTTWIFLEGDFISPVHCLFYTLPSLVEIKTIEPCRLHRINYASLTSLANRFPELERFMAQFYLQQLADLEIALHKIPYQTARQRYEEVISMNPAFVQRIPLKYIASWLQMSPSTLSRIRRRISKQK